MKLSRELKTGIIVIGGVILFVLGFSFLKSADILEFNDTYYAKFDHSGGLQAGTKVTVNGNAVGKVKSVQMIGSSGKSVVVFSVENWFQFSKESRVELYDASPLGTKGLQILIPANNENAMNLAKSGDTISSTIKAGMMASMTKKIDPLLANVQNSFVGADSVLTNINDLLDVETKRNLRQSVVNLNATTSELNLMLTRNKSKLENTLSDFNEISANLKSISAQLDSIKWTETGNTLTATLKNIEGVMTKIEKGEGTLGKLSQDEALYENLSGSLKELDLLLQDFRLNPKRYVNVSVFGKKQKEYTYPENDPAADQQ